MWITVFCFSIRTLGLFNWTMIGQINRMCTKSHSVILIKFLSILGPALYVLLFAGSIEFSESITCRRYVSSVDSNSA